ncbi:DUF3797 domain-containing protein [Paenibacillus xylanexedens]|uniref:DUF3797 domain-containing protein n=1 Tax=Paenibacillus xylanexedens TaxID=528191 RepID=UPI0011A6A714|nr:DUF3797 domain-containing protein [Paenibacillus xylanexedens]
MNALKAIQLMNKYSKCKKCGNDKVGGDEGVLSVEDNIFIRSCKCGWEIEIDTDK